MSNAILFVDDEVVILNALKAIFTREGFQTYTATCGEEALKILEHEEIDVVVSDERMPGITGMELLSQVKERYPDKIRIVLTAYAELSTMLSAINKVEAHRLIVKPFRNDEIVQTVRDLMNRQEKGRANERSLQAAERESDFAYRAAKIMCGTPLSMEEKYHRIVILLKNYIRAHTLSLMIYHPSQEELVVQAATNKNIIGKKRHLRENSISSQVAREGRPMKNDMHNHSQQTPDIPIHDRNLTQYKSPYFLSVPVMDENHMIGVFNISDPEEGKISSSTEMTVTHLVRWVGAMVQQPSLD